MEQEQMQEVPSEVINEARSQGWVPMEEFRDDEETWVDAETFVKRGREINPILRKHNQDLRKEIEKTRKEAQEAIEAAKEFRQFQQEAFERKERELQKEISQLKEARKVAISQGDGVAAVDIEDRIEELKEEKSALKKPEPQKEEKPEVALDPELQSWLSRNEWYGKEFTEEDTEMTNAIAASLRRKNPSLLGKAFLDELDRKLEEKGIGKVKRQKPAAVVEGGSTTRPSGPTKGRSYNDLPAEAKVACDMFVKQGLVKSKEDYLANYSWD